MLASHCNERYACEAFDYNEGRCNKAFFDTVCKTRASVGKKPNYPRRFSDMPGFEWFRDWPHSFDESCALSTKLTRLKAANGRMIGVKEHHRLRALCHLYTRCVREHPDQCDSEAEEECPETEEARLRKEFKEEDAKTTFWALDFAPIQHAFRHGGTILFPSALFMMLIVASELAHVHTSATQYMICLEVANQQQKYDETHLGCCSKAGLYAARLLLFLIRDCVILNALFPSVMSIVSVASAFDIIFCGTIAVVILQADQYLFSTIMTDTHVVELSDEFTLILTREQCDRLQIELTVTFWCAFLWMNVAYFGTVHISLPVMEHPDEVAFLETYTTTAIVGFAITSDLIVEVWCTCRERFKGIEHSGKDLCCRFTTAAFKKLGASILCFIFIATLDISIWSYRRSNFQATRGDVRFEYPYNLLSWFVEES